jgi:hypothetical protein
MVAPKSPVPAPATHPAPSLPARIAPPWNPDVRPSRRIGQESFAKTTSPGRLPAEPPYALEPLSISLRPHIRAPRTSAGGNPKENPPWWHSLQAVEALPPPNAKIKKRTGLPLK